MYEKFEGQIVLHQDDVGMCHGANVAFSELSALGSITSGSVMVPCPWFREAAEMAAANKSLDLGVHLTLTAEKEFYRWRPLTSAGKSSGLVDDDGYMWRDVSSVRREANVDAVALELRAQIDFALASGFDVTHLDAHMGATLAPEFCAIYIALGVEYRLPVLLTKKLSQYGPNNHITGVSDERFEGFINFAEQTRQPIFDRVLETDFGRPSTQSLAPDAYQKMFTKSKTGLTFAALHPNAPGEVEVIEPNQFHVRTQEYEIFSSKDYLTWLTKNEITPIGMRELRDAMRLVN
jgi:chitin disaccharide deacetylase